MTVSITRPTNTPVPDLTIFQILATALEGRSDFMAIKYIPLFQLIKVILYLTLNYTCIGFGLFD